MTPRTRFAYSAIVVTLLLFTGASLPGQGSEPTFIPIGLHPKQAYFAQLPFESIDMVNGNLILTFTDLVLPGDGGMDLVVQRTFNRQGEGWHFGLRGVPTEVTNPEAPWPQGDPDRIRPSLRTADGTDHATTPYSSLSATDIWITDNFWRYTKDTRTVELPNGWTARYSSDTGRAMLQEVTDTYGNRITVDWEYPQGALRPRPLAFTQHLASGTRQITFTYDNSSRLTPEKMTFAGRTWTYAYGTDWPYLTSVTPPEGAPWQFDYSNGLLVTTPHGGTVRYQFEPQTFPDGAPWPLEVVRSRTTDGRAVESGTWQFTYAPQTTSQNGSFGTAAGPQGQSIEFRHDWAQFTSRWVLTRKAIREQGQELAVLDRSYTNLSKVPWGSAIVPVPQQDTITRDGVAHQITYAYRQNSEAEHFGDFHRPFSTTETGPLSRQTVVEYDYGFNFYAAGPVKHETVTVDGESFSSSFEHEDSTGFRTSQTIYGITTTFGRDGSGNRTSATDANGHTTTTTYAWGVAKDTTTPEYGIARSINHDGTVASESRGDLTLTFAYDDLGRPERVTESGADDTITSYGASEVTVSRGPTYNTTYLDGFGRPIGTSNSAGVVTEIAYDALGNRRFQSYPVDLGAPMIGDAFEYDVLGRVTRVTHADGSDLSYDYSGGNTHITDELGRTTIQRWRAFGDPDDARLTSVRDARGREWSYTYNALGSLESATAPDGTVRSWDYDHRNLLESETHPESGTVSFDYDSVGNVIYKRDAEREFSYSYDRNNRLEKISTPDGIDDVEFEYDDLDNRTLIKNATVESTLHYQHGRLERRDDAMAGRTFETSYQYDGRGNLRRVDYPSDRYVRYVIDSGDRVSEVRGSGDGGEQVFAHGIQYHPSGAIKSFTYANGQQETLTLDARERPDLLSSGPLSLDYAYSAVGNVDAVTDARGSAFSSTFGYDDLDRLTGVSGFGARTFSYDDQGNRLTQQAGAVQWGYTYANNRLMSIQAAVEFGGGAFTYDAAGNMRADPGGRTYDYNSMNMMTRATTAAGVSTYGYDGDNLRKHRSTDDGVFYYIHGLGGQLLAEYDASSGEPEVLREYIYLGTRLLASIGRGARPAPPLSVRLAEPRNSELFPNDEPLRLTALPEITIPGDTIARVEFYRDGIHIASVSSAPFSVDWTSNLPVGTYRLVARAVSAGGRSAVSAPVLVRFFAPGRVTGVSIHPDPVEAGIPAEVTVTGNQNICGAVGLDFGDGTSVVYPYDQALAVQPFVRTHTWMTPGVKTVIASGHGICRSQVSITVDVKGPVVDLTAPAPDASFVAPATITLEAAAHDTGTRSIARVDFYAGTALIGTATAPPYRVVWSGAGPGTHTVSARAINTAGITASSPPRSLTVMNLSGVTIQPSPLTTGQSAQITVTGGGACSALEFDFQDGTPAQVLPISGLPFTTTRSWSTPGTKTITVTGHACAGTVQGTVVVLGNTPPTISLTSPANGSIYAGPGTVPLAANASDSDGAIARVEFYAGTTLIGQALSPPYAATWVDAPDGTHSITAHAIDDFGARTTSMAANISVTTRLTAVTAAPTAVIVGQPSQITVQGSPGCAAVLVQFGDGWEQTYPINGLPFAVNHVWASAGSYTITATGQGACGGTSSTTLTVNPNPAPSVSLTAPSNNSTFLAGSSITLEASASDPHGIQKVEFYRGTTLLAERTSAPYTLDWTVPSGASSLTAKAYDTYGAVATSAAAAVTGQDIVGVTVSPASPRVGDAALVTVTGSTTCGAVKIDYGDGTFVVYAIDGLPISQYHTWTTGGTKTITVTGQGACVGQATTTVTVNAKPAITLTSPANGNTYAAPASVLLSASASDSDGSISQVVFTANGSTLATVTVAPYTHSWTNVAAGSYTVSATAIDNLGATTSATASITVTNPGPSTVTSVVAPASAGVGQWVTATVYGTNPCGLIRVEWGDGQGQHFPVSTLPYSAGHQWSAPGTYTITARGDATCGGQASTVITVTSPPAPAAAPSATPAEGHGPFVPESYDDTRVESLLQRVLVRDRRDAVVCVIETSEDEPTATVAIRVPATPMAALLEKLAPTDRDFSTRPVTVRLVGPIDAEADAGEDPGRPLSVADGFVYPVIDGAASQTPFVRVTYPRAALVAGRDVVAQRRATAPAGEEIVTETRCRLTAPAGEGAGWPLAIEASGPFVPESHEIEFPAEAVQATATLHVTLMGSGSGSVSGGGLTCTGALGETCGGTFQVGAVITLSALASTGTFGGWGGACSGTGACTVTLTASTLVAATFNLPPPTVTQFYHLDVLGSVRAVTGADGAVLRRHDYAAFGEELHTEEAEPGLPYVAKQQRFTGKERDGESGLDYFGARYYGAAWGRFTTVDPILNVAAGVLDPQRWNRYSNVSNRPTRRVDPDGRYEIDVHRYLTAALSRAAGFSPAMATEIAKANQGVDDSIWTSPFVAPWNLDENHFTTPKFRDEMWRQFEQTGSLSDLGVFLHAHQDSYSHAGYRPIPGHLFDGHAPDKTYLRPDLADRMAESTFNRLQAALSRLEGRSVRIAWKDIERFVQQFNRAKSLEDKLQILNSLLGFIHEREQK